MKQFKTHLILALCLLLSTPLIWSCQGRQNEAEKNQKDRYVVVLSCDGFRSSYFDEHPTPALHRMAQEGLRSSLIPCFPSLTFPNHYSLATGLYPEHHGIVHNTFYDKELGRYSIGDRESVENPDFYGGEPIWITAKKQGLKTASYYWIGTETKIQGMQPDHWYKYDGKVPFKDRADQVIEWLRMPEEERPRLIMWYMSEPDHAGHHHGAESVEVKEQVARVDDVIAYFMDQLAGLPIADQVDFIVVSDHGMATFDTDHYINLADQLKREHFEHIVEGVPSMLYGSTDDVDDVLQRLEKVPYVKAYKKGQLPERFMYNDNDRIGDIVVVPEPGTQLQFRRNGKATTGGAHGYDNQAPEMQAIFFAVGPDFEAGSTHEAFENITLYPLICKLLGLTPAPNDADEAVAESLLKAKPQED